jgi:hypothetical protein
MSNIEKCVMSAFLGFTIGMFISHVLKPSSVTLGPLPLEAHVKTHAVKWA